MAISSRNPLHGFPQDRKSHKVWRKAFCQTQSPREAGDGRVCGRQRPLFRWYSWWYLAPVWRVFLGHTCSQLYRAISSRCPSTFHRPFCRGDCRSACLDLLFVRPCFGRVWVYALPQDRIWGGPADPHPFFEQHILPVAGAWPSGSCEQLESLV